MLNPYAGGRSDTRSTGNWSSSRHSAALIHPYSPALLTVMICIVLAAFPAQLQASGSPVVNADPGPLHVKVVEQWPGGLILDLTLNGMAAEQVTLLRQDFQRLLIPGAGRLAIDGRPELPAVGRYIAVPHGARVEVEILEGREVRVPGLRPLPHQPPRIDDRGQGADVAAAGPDPTVYGSADVYPARRVEVETAQDVHGCRVALVKLYPVRYDPAGHSLLYTKRLRVQLLFSGGNGRFIDPRHRTPAFETFFRALLLNAASLGQPPSRRGQPPPACEMLIITPEMFYDEARRLAEWKNRRGIPTLVRTTAETGYTAGEITDWIRDRYNGEWPGLSYLLLFGDVGEEDSVPCHYTIVHEVDEIQVGTDLYYGVMEEGKPGQLSFPDLFMGRISVNTVDQAATVVDKILGYEQSPDTTSGWLDSVLLGAYYENGRYFVSTSEAIHNHLTPLGYSCNTRYEASGQNLTTAVLQAINDGVFLVTHRDHGQDRNSSDPHTGWIHPEFTEQHIPQLTNGNRLPVMLSVNCRSGWFDGETDGHPGFAAQSFCEELLRRDGGGVVGVIGDTRTSYSGYNDELIKGFIDAIWEQFDPGYPVGGAADRLPSPLYQMGAVLNFGKLWMYDKFIVPEGAGYPPWMRPTAERNQIQFEVYHYHGDPSMEIWTGTPADELLVEHNNQAFIGDTSFTVAVEPDDALVALAMNGVLLGRALSAGGQAVVQFSRPLDQLGEMTVCVTMHGQLPYLDGMVNVLPPDGPYVLYQGHQLDDTPAGGNGDGLVSPGEELDIHLTLQNYGNAPAYGVVATLDSDSGMVDILQGQADYPTIGPGETVAGLQPFRIGVRPDCPDREVIHFTVHTAAGESSWESGFFIVVDGAHVPHYSHQILDNLPGAGNQNFIADPGERFDLRVSLRNMGVVYASQVTAQLATDEPGVTIEEFPELVHFPNIAAGNVGTSYSPHFRLALDESIECGTVIPFTMLVSAAEGLTSTGFELLVGGLETVFADDMEQGDGEWEPVLVSGEVDWSRVLDEPPGNYGYAWHTPGEAIVKDNWLISPEFLVTRSSTLSFRHRVDMETGFDGCVLEITTDGGDTWTDLGNWITRGPYTHQIPTGTESPIGGRPAWSGTSGPTMTRVEVDLDHFADELARVGYRMACDRSVESGSGWHIDDVVLEGVLCDPWMSPDETISLDMACTPVSATLPFDVLVEVTVSNDTDHWRGVAASLDLQLAGGYYMANITTGFKGIGPLESAIWSVPRVFPGHPLLVGINTFRVSVQDVTDPPYNQPPHPTSGDTARGTCDVECLIP